MNATKQVQINRDPFARVSLMREKASGECAWCGQPARFAYHWEDDSRTFPDIGRARERVFCSVGCYRSFSS